MRFWKNFSAANPLVKLNPYGISPLTALILFKTSENVEVTIEVVGKDKFSSVTHTFTTNTEHILPIYGLYADYDNQVILACQTARPTRSLSPQNQSP